MKSLAITRLGESSVSDVVVWLTKNIVPRLGEWAVSVK